MFTYSWSSLHYRMPEAKVTAIDGGDESMEHKKSNKSLFLILVILALAFGAAMLSAKEKGGKTFDGTIMEFQEKSVIVQPFQNEKIRKYGGEIRVRTDGEIISGQENLENLKVGEKVKVLYDDEPDESVKPPEIKNVFRITSLTEIE